MQHETLRSHAQRKALALLHAVDDLLRDLPCGEQRLEQSLRLLRRPRHLELRLLGRRRRRRRLLLAQTARDHVADRVGGFLLPNEVDDVLGDLRLELLELLEAFLLVLVLRIDLRVAAQPDAALQDLHRVQVVLPLLVDGLEHEEALDALPVLLAVELLALRIQLLDLLHDPIEQPFAALLLQGFER